MELSPAVRATSAIMAGYPAPWWIAGGWALDCFLGRVSRPHHDVDVAVLRRDQAQLREFLAGWQVVWLRPGSSATPEDWEPGRWLEPPVHQVRAVHNSGSSLELLLNEADGADWVYRRQPAVRRPLARVTMMTASGLPFLAPEIVLLYKAKAPRAVDTADFWRMLPHITGEQRQWLRAAISQSHGDHSWRDALAR